VSKNHKTTTAHSHTPHNSYAQPSTSAAPRHSTPTARMRRLLQPRPCAAVARRTAFSSTRPSPRHQHHQYRLEQHQYHYYQHHQQQQQQQQQQQRLYSSASSSSHAWLGTHSSNEDKRSGSLPPLPIALNPSRSASSSSFSIFSNSSSFAAVAAITSRHGRRNNLFPSLTQHQLRAFSATPPSSSSPSSPPSSIPPPPPPDTPAKKPTWKDLFKKYGPVFLIYWNGVWLLGGLSIYGALELGNVDPLPLARAIHLDSLIDLNKIDPAHGNVAVAIILNEVAELVRFPFVLATVPKVSEEGGTGEGGTGEGRTMPDWCLSCVPPPQLLTHPFLSHSFPLYLGHCLVGRTQARLLPPCPSGRRLRPSFLG